jgi:hypothetical protein
MVDEVVDHHTIVRKIRYAIPYPDCKIVSNKTLTVISNNFDIAGLYDPEKDEDGERCIEIEIGFPKRKDFYYFNESDLSRNHWSEFCINFSLILGHEYMHLNQFRRRNFNWCRSYKGISSKPNIREHQEYYGDSDEIDAYAFTAAANIITDSILNPKSKKNTVEYTKLYKTYLTLFDKNDPVVLKFVRLTNRYLKKLEHQYHDTVFT